VLGGVGARAARRDPVPGNVRPDEQARFSAAARRSAAARAAGSTHGLPRVQGLRPATGSQRTVPAALDALGRRIGQGRSQVDRKIASRGRASIAAIAAPFPFCSTTAAGVLPARLTSTHESPALPFITSCPFASLNACPLPSNWRTFVLAEHKTLRLPVVYIC